MAVINELRTLAFRLSPDVMELIHSCKVLPFPAKWNELIGNLTLQANRRYRPQVKALKQLSLALFPHLIFVEDYLGKPGWLYSTKEIEAKHLHLVFSTWMTAEFNQLPAKIITRADEQIYAENLEWRDESHDLAETTCNKWGTVELSSKESFFLVPELVANSLSRPGVKFDYHSKPLHFRRAPSVGKGVELISWPPFQHEDQSGRWAYSVFLKFTLQTVPFQSYPVVYCDMGLRRWVSKEGARLGRAGHSVYLLTRFPDIEADDHTHRFQIASIRWQKQNSNSSNGNGSSPFKLVWDDLLPDLFTKIHPPDRLPDPNEMILKPLPYMNQRSVKAAIVFDGSRMDPWAHGVSPGLMPVNRSHLTKQIADHLKKEFSFIFDNAPTRVRGTVVRKAPHNIFFEKNKAVAKDAKRQATDRRRAVATTAGGELRLELWTQSSTACDTLLKSIKEIFGLKRPAKQSAHDGRYLWQTPELNISVDLIQLGDLALPLEASFKKDQQQRAFWRRVERVQQAVKENAQPIQKEQPTVCALVELKDQYAEEYKKGGADPKKALRIGFAQAGRLTQFITPDEEGIENRAKMSLLDLLRQLGVQPALPQCSTQIFSRPPKYAAVLLLKPKEGSKSFLPVMLYMSGDGSDIKATANGMGEFLPYPQFLLRLAKKDGIRLIYNNERHKIPLLIQGWLRKIAKGEDILLLTHAQNTREGWSWLNNGQLSLDNIGFQQDDSLIPISKLAGLRVVRVRDCTNSETPECYAQKDEAKKSNIKDDMSFASGLFQHSERVFHSLTGKPKQQKNLSRNASKARTPGMQAWNARIVELAVACKQQDDEAWHWAMLTHRLREAAGHFDEPITLPLPLHLLSNAIEYILVDSEGG